jgi:hypothetical protein
MPKKIEKQKDEPTQEKTETTIPEPQTVEIQPPVEAQPVSIEEEEEEDETFEDDEEEETEFTGSGTKQKLVMKQKAVTAPVVEIDFQLNDYEISNAMELTLKTFRTLGIEEVTWEYNGDLHARVMNDNRIAMVDATVSFTGLSSLTATMEKKPIIRKFTTNVQALNRALKMSHPKIHVGQNTMTVHDSDTTITVPLLDDNVESYPEPKLEFPASFESKLDGVFSEITKYFGSENNPEYLRFDANDGKMTISTASNGQTFEKKGISCVGSAKASYSTKILRALRSYGWTVNFNTDLPLLAKYTSTKTSYNNARGSAPTKTAPTKTVVGQLAIFLAPRVESE